MFFSAKEVVSLGCPGRTQVLGVGSKADSLQGCLLGQKLKEVAGGLW